MEDPDWLDKRASFSGGEPTSSKGEDKEAAKVFHAVDAIVQALDRILSPPGENDDLAPKAHGRHSKPTAVSASAARDSMRALMNTVLRWVTSRDYAALCRHLASGTFERWEQPAEGEAQAAQEAAGALQYLVYALKDTSTGRPTEVRGDYFVFALPVEQMAYYVNRSTALMYHDPSLQRIVVLAQCLGWMAGIQFYLNAPLNIATGHIVCMDSDWGLTAIEQSQFWRERHLGAVPLGGRAVEPKAILSVDIADWDNPGRYVQKEAYNCTADEIAEQVWSELKASFNERAGPSRLRDEMLLGGPKLVKGINYELDDSIADVHDRKKQSMYERARGAMFDGVALAQKVGLEALNHEIARAEQAEDPFAKSSGSLGAELPYVWGAARELNAEPLLINYTGSLAFRPNVQTAISNMFLAGDYVRTSTDLACMEGANEAARLAVNALLDAAGSLHPRCSLWPLSVARAPFAMLREAVPAGPVQELAERTAGAAGGVANFITGIAGQAVAKWRERKG
jgi:hypothetical protein